MKFCYLKNKDSKDLILFFAGFGADISHFSHLDSKCDVIMIYDYVDFYFDLSFLFKYERYENITLIAFSMGVCISSFILDSKLDFKQKIAINGTNYGINNTFGISEKIFKLTAKHFNLNDFKNMLFESIDSKLDSIHFATRNHLIQELESIYNFAKKRNICNKKNIESGLFSWNKAIISKQDRIFPSQHSLNFFNLSNTKHIILNEPHFIFFAFNTWEEICQI